MNLPADCFYTRSDLWLRRDGDIFTVGITDYGQNELGELVLVEMSPPGNVVSAGESFGVVESVKAVSELVSPIVGEIFEGNQALSVQPELVNVSPFERGWLAKIKIAGEVPALMDAAEYAAFRKL
jgi:glycine cleavage system H protein